MADNLYPITIPEYTDSADIRKAFYRYHYGTDDAVTNVSEIQPNSIAKYLDDTINALNAAQDRLGSISLLGASVNLNDLVNPSNVGIYQSVDSPSILLNYPQDGERGLLSVVLAENSPGSIAQNTVYQTYQSQSVQTTNNNFYWRSGIFNPAINTYQWSAWQKASVDGHTHSEYVTTNTLNSRVSSLFTNTNVLAANRATVTDANGTIIPSSVTATQIGYLGGLEESISSSLSKKANSSHNHDTFAPGSGQTSYYAKHSYKGQSGIQHTARVFVQSNQPLGNDPDPAKQPQVDDLWFW